MLLKKPMTSMASRKSVVGMYGTDGYRTANARSGKA